MITQAPLPTWVHLFRAIVRRPPSDADLAASWRREGELAGWLSRSAWSLALITLWRQNRSPTLQITVWLPDFFCNSSLLALRWTGAKLVFYPLTTKMAPDITACRVLMEANPPDLFLLVHYFGQPTAFASTRDFCKHHGTWLIEDATHVLRPVDGIGVCGDFVMYSPHKNLPIPDGAVLVVRPNGPSQFGVATLTSFGLPVSWSGQLRDLQQQMGREVNRSRVQILFWLGKRVLQKLGIRSWRKSVIPFAEPFDLDKTASTKLTLPSQSCFSPRLLAGIFCDLGAFARQRQRHQLLWDTVLMNDEDCYPEMVLATERSENREWTPYLGAYQADSATAQFTYEKWQEMGLPVTTWPDLPPEVMGSPERHAKALYLRHSRFYLPVHQSLNSKLILKQCRLLRPIHENNLCLNLVWDDVSPEQWLQWMVQIGRSNLLQSWAYGEAKADDSNWHVKRGVFYRDGEPIAFVQVLQKRVAGLMLVSRINRGPLFLSPPLAKEQLLVWKELAGLGCLRRGKLLAVAPEIGLSGSGLAMMEGLGFRQFSPVAWESVWLDLRMDLAELRKKLDGKWRNMLTFAEKSGLKLETGSDDQSFGWMMQRYQELMRDKDFRGAPISMLLALRKHMTAETPLIIMRAMHDDEAVAGICLALHGSTATYLLGWNGHAGRNLKANQYLLWQAIVYLKQSGLDWFDLGGISEDHTPGIAAFKLGLRGERYELAGEYWKW